MKLLATRLLICAGVSAGSFFAEAQPATTKDQVLRQLDFNDDGVLDEVEVAAGLEFKVESGVNGKAKIDLKKLKTKKHVSLADLGTLDPSLPTFQRIFKHDFGSPPYAIPALLGNPTFSAKKEFGLADELLAQPSPTPGWRTEDKGVIHVVRTIDDLNNTEVAKIGDKPGQAQQAAKGALLSYSSDFNSGSDQWAVHGVLGLNFAQELVRDQPSTPGTRAQPALVERWIRPSLALDKVNTSKSSKDEVDAVVFRLASGGVVTGIDSRVAFIDGFSSNFSATYATDTSAERSVLAGELNFQPIRDPSGGQLGLNSRFQPIFGKTIGVRPELIFHVEGGTVLDDAGIPALMQAKDFLRAGASFGFSARCGSAVVKHAPMLKGLLLHAGMQYYVDVTGNGPDVDLFLASANWSLDPDGHYTLTAEYRNGRSPLVLQRDNRVTIGLGVKY